MKAVWKSKSVKALSQAELSTENLMLAESQQLIPKIIIP